MIKKYISIIILVLIFFNIFYICKSYSNENEQILYGEENQYYNEYLKNITGILDKKDEDKYLKYFHNKFGANIPISEQLYEFNDKKRPCKIIFMIKKDGEENEEKISLYLRCQDNKNYEKEENKNYYVQLILNIENKKKLTLYTTHSDHLCCLLFANENWNQCYDYGFEEPLCNNYFFGRNIIYIQ